MSQAKAAKSKNADRGQVQVRDDGKGNLTLQVPSVYAQHYYGLKQKYISFGAKDTPHNRVLAMTAAIQMNEDLEVGKFDPQGTVKYQHPSKQLGERYVSAQLEFKDTDLMGLYKEFVNQLTLAETTRRHKYEKTYPNHLNRMVKEEGYTLKQQSEIAAWIKKGAAPVIALSMLALMYRLIEWAKREYRLPEDFPNKFKEYESEFKKSLRTVDLSRKQHAGATSLMPREGIKAWTEAERDLIIQAFYSRRKSTRNTNGVDCLPRLIEFLFNTGCRHGEAFALTWGSVSQDFKTVHISKSYSGAFKVLKGTKTGKVRTVPLNLRAQQVLKELKPANAGADTLVFSNRNGDYYQGNNARQYWDPSYKISVIGKLIKEGALTCYLDMYSTRRTFVSLQINKGVPVTTVAKWVGDNPETILKHYARPDDEAVPY